MLPTLVPTLQLLVQTIMTDVEIVYVQLVKPGVLLNQNASPSQHVVPLLTDVENVSHSFLVIPGVALLMLVRPSQLLVPATMITVVTVCVQQVKPGVLLSLSVLLFQAVVLPMTTVVIA